MELIIYAVSDELDDIFQPLSDAIGQWLTAPESLGMEAQPYVDVAATMTGIRLRVKKPVHLKDPLNGLYALAKQFNCDFVLSMQVEEGELEEICFFGCEEGRPDTFEIACYIGL